MLYLDWQGSLTLSAVQVASAQVAQLVLARRYSRVLICTQQVRAIGYDVTTWLAPNILPGLCLLGVSQVAWVYQASLEGAALAYSFSAGLTLPTRLFTDTATAVAWLVTQPGEPTATRSPSELTRLRRVVGVLQWKVLVMLARHPLWLLAEFPIEASSLTAPNVPERGWSIANETVLVR